jgi:hypothetical protein
VDLTIRTPAGASNVFSVPPDPRLTVSQLTDRAVAYFAAHDQLEPGTFRLGLIRGRTIIDLLPDVPLLDEGIVDGDVLHLITCEPQVDGMALHPVLRHRLLDTEIGVLEERLAGRGVAVHRSGSRVHVTAPELGADRVLVLDAAAYDTDPVAVSVTTPDGAPVPGWRWPPALYRGDHPVLRRPFACIQGTEDYHAHPAHRDDPWDQHRSRLRLADLVAHILRRCRR